MSNYRRLISYIYAYEGGIKGKNIGFAKIETRGAQCKITVSVKKVYVGGNDIGVYLLAGEKEILLGNIFIRGGSGEFRTVVSVNDVEHSQIPMDQCCGLTVHDVENMWRSYTTIWEDAVAHAAEVELSNTPSGEKGTEGTAREAQIKKAMKEIAKEFPVEAGRESQKADERQEKIAREQLKAFTESAREQSKAFADRIRRQVERSADSIEQTAKAWTRQQENGVKQSEGNMTYIEPARPEKAPVSDIRSHQESVPDMKDSVQELYQPQQKTQSEETVNRVKKDSPRSYSGFPQISAVEYSSELMPDVETISTIHTGMPESSDAQQSYTMEESSPVPERKSSNEERQDEELCNQERGNGFSESIPGETVCYRADTTDSPAAGTKAGDYTAQAVGRDNPETELNSRETQAVENARKKPELHMAKDNKPVPGDIQKLERLLKTGEEEENSNAGIWDKLRREHTKIQDFDYEKGCEILTVKPQDIGLLPREVWVYGNNSFLLHGYYNYRYLILAKLFNPEGAARYLLGVPGHYYSNERYMASMFGFPGFVLSKNQPMEDGRFGYWYTDIKIGS